MLVHFVPVPAPSCTQPTPVVSTTPGRRRAVLQGYGVHSRSSLSLVQPPGHEGEVGAGVSHGGFGGDTGGDVGAAASGTGAGGPPDRLRVGKSMGRYRQVR